jgi:hypothetical protein
VNAGHGLIFPGQELHGLFMHADVMEAPF